VANQLFPINIDSESTFVVVFPLTKQSNVFGLYSIIFEILLVQTGVCEDKSKKRILFAKKYQIIYVKSCVNSHYIIAQIISGK
jgi:hypothetical protein